MEIMTGVSVTLNENLPVFFSIYGIDQMAVEDRGKIRVVQLRSGRMYTTDELEFNTVEDLVKHHSDNPTFKIYDASIVLREL